VPTERYESKGKFSVNIVYHFAEPIRRIRQFCDTRRYNTENEREEYIQQSITTYRKFAQAYDTKIVALKVDNKFWNPHQIGQALS